MTVLNATGGEITMTLQHTQIVRLTAEQASRLCVDGDGKSILNANTLGQWRFRNKRGARKPGDPDFEGPRYVYVGKHPYYLLKDIVSFMQGDMEEVMPPQQFSQEIAG